MTKEKELLIRAASLFKAISVYLANHDTVEAKMWLEDYEEWKKEKKLTQLKSR